MCAVYVGQAVLAELRRIIEESEIIRCANHRRRHLTASLTCTTDSFVGRWVQHNVAQRNVNPELAWTATSSMLRQSRGRDQPL